MKKLNILIGTLILSAGLAGCSSSYYASSGYANDDLYALHDKTAIARKQQAAAEARKAEAEKMKSILTTEQFVQWSQMQAPRPGERGPQMMHKGDRRGGGKECCDKPCPKKDKKGKE